MSDELNFDTPADAGKTAPVPAPAVKQPPFEELLARLEAVVGEMESGRLSLEACLARFEEGTKLATACSKRLEETERRVELLMRRGNEVQAKPFPGES